MEWNTGTGTATDTSLDESGEDIHVVTKKMAVTSEIILRREREGERDSIPSPRQ